MSVHVSPRNFCTTEYYKKPFQRSEIAGREFKTSPGLLSSWRGLVGLAGGIHRAPPLLVTTVNIEKSTATNSWLCSLKISSLILTPLFYFSIMQNSGLLMSFQITWRRMKCTKTLICPVALCFEWRTASVCQQRERTPEAVEIRGSVEEVQPRMRGGGGEGRRGAGKERHSEGKVDSPLNTGTHPRYLKWWGFQNWITVQSRCCAWKPVFTDKCHRSRDTHATDTHTHYTYIHYTQIHTPYTHTYTPYNTFHTHYTHTYTPYNIFYTHTPYTHTTHPYTHIHTTHIHKHTHLNKNTMISLCRLLFLSRWYQLRARPQS